MRTLLLLFVIGAMLLRGIPSAGVRCPQCVAANLTSKVRCYGWQCTLAACTGGYYDEAGHYVSNECNNCRTECECGNGHTFVLER
jgi:hypothetical protein